MVDPRLDHTVEKKKVDVFYDDFHDVNNFLEADQIQLLSADTSEVASPTQPFSPQSSSPDALIRASISAKQTSKVLAYLDEDNILSEMVSRIRKKINRKEEYATALDSKMNRVLKNFYAAILAFFLSYTLSSVNADTHTDTQKKFLK